MFNLAINIHTENNFSQNRNYLRAAGPDVETGKENKQVIWQPCGLRNGENCVIKKLLPAPINCLKLSFIRYYTEADAKRSAVKYVFPNPDVTKDIVLYRYENPGFFNKLKWISFSQYLIWTCLGVSGYQLISIFPQSVETRNNEKWWTKFTSFEQKVLEKLCILIVIFGTALITCIWFYMFRSVKRIVLKNNGKDVLFHTYSPFKAYREFTVPLENVSGVKNRKKVKMYLPLKVYKSPLYFLLDMNGEFQKPALFDITVALKRDFEKENRAKKGG